MHPPPTGAGRVVTHGDLQPGLGRQPGELHLPGPGPGGVGPAGVGADQQPPRGRIAGGPVGPPPAAQHRHGERRGVRGRCRRSPTRRSRPGRRCHTGSPCRSRRRGSRARSPAPGGPQAAIRHRRWRTRRPSPSSWRPPTRPADRRPGTRARARRCSGTGRPGPGAGRPRRPWRYATGCSPRPSAAAPPSAPSPGRPLDRQAPLAAQALVTRIC
jgi:hypothetical protein